MSISNKVNFFVNRSVLQRELYSLAGPFLSLGALSILFIHHSPLFVFLCCVTFLGIGVCRLWQFPGFFASSLLLLFSFFYQIFHLHIEQPLWHAGVGFALCLSFFIATLCDEKKKREEEEQLAELHSLKENAGIHQEKFQDSQGRITEAYQRMHDSESKAQKLSLELSQQQKEYGEQLSKMQQNLADHQRDFFSLNAELRKGLLEKEEALHLTKFLQEELLKEKQKSPPLHSLPHESHGWLRRSEGMYKQLREQFEEKNNVLEEVRRELFFTQEKYILLQREYEDRWCENKTLDSIEKYLIKLEEELEILEQENTRLHHLITYLMSSP